jgi:hypothetical protein
MPMSAGGPAPTAGKHCGDRLFFEVDDLLSLRLRQRGTLQRQQFAQKLTMRQIAKIEVRVAASAGNEVGSRDDGLALQRFQRSAGRRLRLDDRSNSRLQIHGYGWYQFAVDGFHIQSSQVMPAYFSWHAKHESCRTVIPAGGLKWSLFFLENRSPYSGCTRRDTVQMTGH